MINVLIYGIGGKMGAHVISAINDTDDVQVVCGVDKFAPETVKVPVYESAQNVQEKVDVLIDFSRPDALNDILAFAEKSGCALVLATTGYSAEQQAKIDAMSAKVPVFLSDDYFKTEKTVFLADVNLSPGESREYPFSFRADRIGAFSLKVKSSGVRSYHGSIAVLGKYVPRKLDFTRDSCVGFNGGTASRLIGKTDELCYPATTGNRDHPFRWLRRDYLSGI